MTKVLLTIPDRLGAWAEEQAASNNFDSLNDYLESLLLKEQSDLLHLAEFDRLIKEGEDSGISERSVDEIVAEAKRQSRARAYGKL